MKRKVFRNGPSLVVTLPSKWVREQGVKEGDELSLRADRNQITLYPSQTKTCRTIALNGSDLDRTFLQAYIRSAYRRGYDELHLHTPLQEVLYHRISKKLSTNFVISQEVNNLLGMEITQENSNQYTIKKISTDSKEDFDTLLRRVFLRTMQHYDELFEALTSVKKLTREVFIQKYRNIKKSMSYLLRLLNKLGSDNPQNNMVLYHLISSLDLVNDLVKDSVRDVFDYDITASAHSQTILKEIKEIVSSYYQLYYNYSHQQVVNLSWKRRALLKNLRKALPNISPQEIVIIHRLEQTVEILYLLSIDIMVLQHG